MKKNINKKNGWTKNKIRVGITILPDVLKLADKTRDSAGYRSRSDFIEEAIKFYAGYVATKDHSEFISGTVADALKGQIKSTEKRICRFQFKEAVELAKIARMMAPLCEVDEYKLESLHERCVDEIKNINGIIKLDSVIRGEM